jgi:phospholipase C
MKPCSLYTSWVVVLLSITGYAQINHFQHVVVIFQENRTPDNLFQGLCVPPFGSSTRCSANPSPSQYDIQRNNWLNRGVPRGTTTPQPVALAAPYDLGHHHGDFTKMCDADPRSGVCRMDGAAGVACSGTCPTAPQFRYVKNTTGILNPYLTLATQYGWANYMFQTNQGPSFPAHQFIFGGTSAPTTADDAAGIFASENPSQGEAGCIAKAGTTVASITPKGPGPRIYPCFEHATLADLLTSAGVSWKYYAPNAKSIWTAPNAINHICLPNAPTGGQCTGADWTRNVDLRPSDVLVDIGKCMLADVSWVIPTGANSDHAGGNTGGGPAWVASIVNMIGGSTCKNADGSSYWASTAILITWDDWGGWYDHVPPRILALPRGDYQYGFRVPMIIVSAYTAKRLINNQRHDFGSILRFIERNYGITEGALDFADARSHTDLSSFFDLKKTARPFGHVAASKGAAFFLQDKTPQTDPDDD